MGEGQRTGEPNALADACPRPGADRPGPSTLQEAARAERDPERTAEAKVLREAVRGSPSGRTPQAERDPQGPHRPGQAAALTPLGECPSCPLSPRSSSFIASGVV